MTVWALFSCVLIVGVLIGDHKLDTLTIFEWAALVLGLVPLMATQLTLGSPNAAKQVYGWLNGVRQPLLYTAGGVTGFFLLSGLIIGRFNPLSDASLIDLKIGTAK